MLLSDKEKLFSIRLCNNFKYCDPGCEYGGGQQCHLQFNAGYSQGNIIFGQDYQNFVSSLFLKNLICYPATPKQQTLNSQLEESENIREMFIKLFFKFFF
jgi:hypothetical protein